MATRRGPRRDGIENRATILRTAAQLFRTDGMGVGMDDIARACGLGVATLYRHFPSKDELFLAVIGDLGEQITGLIDEAMRAEPETALVTLMTSLARLSSSHRGLLDALRLRPEASVIDESFAARIEDRLGQLTRRLHVARVLRRDLDGVDLMTMIRLLALSTALVDDERCLRLAEVLATGALDPSRST